MDAIRKAIDKNVATFCASLRDDLSKIDVASFIRERDEGQELVRILSTILTHKSISPPIDSSNQERLVERCKLWLERIAKKPTSRDDDLNAKIVERINQAYLNSPVEIATACDKVIDPTGNLLGWIREYNLNRMLTKHD